MCSRGSSQIIKIVLVMLISGIRDLSEITRGEGGGGNFKLGFGN